MHFERKPRSWLSAKLVAVEYLVDAVAEERLQQYINSIGTLLGHPKRREAFASYRGSDGYGYFTTKAEGLGVGLTIERGVGRELLRQGVV